MNPGYRPDRTGPKRSASFSPLTARRFIKVLLFWLIMILIPIILIQLTGR